MTASARHDAANLFGVTANERRTPLWSEGAGWTINNEAFYHADWLPSLRLQATYGYSGNISRLATAYTTVSSLSAYSNNEAVNLVRSPPNEKLRWERVKMVNVSLQFATQKQALSGTIAYYHKRASDLLGQAPLDPTLGVIPSFYDPSSYYYGNVANIKGKGIDLQLSSRNIDKRFKWYTDLTLSHATSVVADYLAPEATGSAYLSTDAISPVKGKPVYGIYSYRWAGLNPQTGAPQGYLNGKVSEDYSSILSTTPLDSLVYNGPAQPTLFGALRNTFSWKGFSLSVNISYQAGYYFRTRSVVYSDLYSSWTGSGDYAKRWQQPGDEAHTHVPARAYPADYASDAFYAGSSVLVERGDHIRLADATFSYEVDKKEARRLPFAHLRLYAYAGNLGVLWTANKEHIDPYYNNAPAAGKSFSLGVNVTF